MDMAVKIDNAELQKTMAGIVDRCLHKQQAMKAIGAIVRESIITNFHEGGRPSRWTPSKRGKADSIPGKRPGTLRDTGRLMNSITSQAGQDKVVVGTNVEYAAVHNFGAKKFSFGTVVAKIPGHVRVWRGKSVQVRAHERKMRLPWGDIPARPFMLVQNEDILDIEEVLENYIIKGATR